MQVKDMIKLLQQYPQEAEIVGYDFEVGADTELEVTLEYPERKYFEPQKDKPKVVRFASGYLLEN